MPAASAPRHLHTAAETRELDRLAIADAGISGIVLMKRAGRAAWDWLRCRWPDARSLTVYCGGGNNGGDGYIIAGLAAQQGWQVALFALADPASLAGDAALARDFAIAAGVAPSREVAEPREGVVVDALLGTGISGDVRPAYADAIARINRSGLPVLAVDIPSGLCSDTGRSCGAVVEAAATISFIGLKRGLFTTRGPAVCGEVVFAGLGVPPEILERVRARVHRLDIREALQALPPRRRDAHKGQFGHLLVVGGELGFGGAVAMAAEAALRVGTGLVSVATRAVHVPSILARRPELMVRGVASGAELEPMLATASAVVVGPGLGQSGWSEQLFQRVLASRKPLLIDADGLNLLARHRWQPEPGGPLVITPHPGEAARLLGESTADIQADRFAAVLQLSDRYQAEALLKGAGSLVAGVDGGPVGLCTYGNPGMASGGMGDVLSGVVGGLLAQGVAARDALRLGVCLHGAAGDLAVSEAGEAGMAATDLLDPLRRLLNHRVQARERSPWLS